MTFESDYERRVLGHAFSVYRQFLERRIHATSRRGWTPLPGQVDSNKKRLRKVDELIERWQLSPKETP